MADVLLSENEVKVLGALGNADEYFGNYSFGDLSFSLGIDRDQVRTACRALRSKGYLIYVRNCFTEDGEICGGSYGATKAGRNRCLIDHSIPRIEI